LCATLRIWRVGIIGLDTSHSVRFAELLDDPRQSDHVSGAVIVAAFKGGSPTVAESADRIERFTQEVTAKYNVKLVPTIADLVKYGAVVFGAKRIAVSGPPDGSSRKIVQEIVKFFQMGHAPLNPEESLEVLAFMEAADRSKERNGAPVALEAIK
jgi:hypothetical protein